MNKRAFIFALITAFILTAFITLCGCSDLNASESDKDIYYNENADSSRSYISQQNGGVSIDEYNFPDRVFRNWLTDKANINGYGSDNFLSREEIADIKNITIKGTSDNLITDLKGIEFFTELTNLSVPYNSLISLDLSYNTKLTYLNCSYNKLESLNITALGYLISLYCEFNYLKELDLSGNSALTVIYCRHNLLEKLDFSNNTNLIFIETFDNMLTEIDVSMLSRLEFLHIDHNRLTVLDMSNNLNLKGGGFVVRNNYMQKLILPNIEGFTVYYDDFAEQDPISGYEHCLWYEDENFTIPVTSDVEAKGQTLYVKRLPNAYTVIFSADGASDVPDSVKAFYDEEFFIPVTLPSKTGYKFLYWSDDKYSAGNAYASGTRVVNLAGKKYDGEKITLYAKWQGIEYNVAFDKNSEEATGTMNNFRAVYGTASTLPENTFERQGYDFAGWSLTKGGKITFNDRQSFSNLTSVEGETVTLYAVWTEDSFTLQKPYLDSLASCLETLSHQNYYEEDLSSLNSLYNDAVKKINDAQKDTNLMKNVAQKAINDMNNVSTKEKRASEIAEKWKSENSSALEHIMTYPIPEGMAESYLQETISALAAVEIQNLSSYSSLINQTDREDAAEKAFISLKAYTDACLELANAAQWITETEVLTEIPMSSVLPKNEETCRFVIDRYYSLSQEEKKYINEFLLDELKEVHEIALSKIEGLEKLDQIYKNIDQSIYSEDDIVKINLILKNSQSSVLSAENAALIDSIITSASEQIKDVLEGKNDKPPSENTDEDDPDPEKPDPDDPDTEDPETGPDVENDNGYNDKTLITAIAVTCFVSAFAAILSVIIVFYKKIKNKNNI